MDKQFQELTQTRKPFFHHQLLKAAACIPIIGHQKLPLDQLPLLNSEFSPAVPTNTREYSMWLRGPYYLLSKPGLLRVEEVINTLIIKLGQYTWIKAISGKTGCMITLRILKVPGCNWGSRFEEPAPYALTLLTKKQKNLYLILSDSKVRISLLLWGNSPKERGSRSLIGKKDDKYKLHQLESDLWFIKPR